MTSNLLFSNHLRQFRSRASEEGLLQRWALPSAIAESLMEQELHRFVQSDRQEEEKLLQDVQHRRQYDGPGHHSYAGATNAQNTTRYNPAFVTDDDVVVNAVGSQGALHFLICRG